MKEETIFLIEEILSGEHRLLHNEMAFNGKEFIPLIEGYSFFILQTAIDDNIKNISNLFEDFFEKVNELKDKNKNEIEFDIEDEFSEILLYKENIINSIAHDAQEKIIDLCEEILNNSDYTFPDEVNAAAELLSERIENISTKLINIVDEISRSVNELLEIREHFKDITTHNETISNLESDISNLESEDEVDEDGFSINEDEIDELEREKNSEESNIKSLYDSIESLLEEQAESKYSFFFNKFINNNIPEDELLSKAKDINDYYSIFNEILANEYINILEGLETEFQEMKSNINQSNIFDIINSYSKTKDLKLKEIIEHNTFKKIDIKGSSKIKSITIFNDFSSKIDYLNGETKHNFYANLTWEFIKNNEKIFIEDIFRKKPIYIKQFYLLSKKDRTYKNDNLSSFYNEEEPLLLQFLNIQRNINNYSKIIENLEFKTKIKNCDFKKTEYINDEIENKIYEHNIKKFAFSLVSNKNKHIINEESLKIIKSFFDSQISESVIREGIGKKIASINSADDFNEILRKERNNFFEWGDNFILSKIDNLNANLVYHKNGTLILEVKDFLASKSVGSPSWCISRSQHYFSNYTSKENATQYFIYDFNLAPEDKNSLIGITTHYNKQKKSFHINNAHDKNDFNIKFKEANRLNFITDLIYEHQENKYNQKKIKISPKP